MNNNPLGCQTWIIFLKPGTRTVHLFSFPFIDFRPFNLNFAFAFPNNVMSVIKRPKVIRAFFPLLIRPFPSKAECATKFSGIRSALFESDRFQQTQIIVTCHSPEFIKDVQNHLPRGLRGDCQEYLLLNHEGDHQPRVRPDVGSSNYLARANDAMMRLDPRDALSQCRKALEMMAKKSWKWLESHRIGDLSVQIEGPGKEPQLRTLCESLRRKLLDLTTFAHGSKQPLIDGLNMVLGIPSTNLIWKYLNKGTHEDSDRDDFDRTHVETLIHALEAIDALELRPNR